MNRTFIISYLAEERDQSVDREAEVTVPNIDFAIPQFRLTTRLCKRITGIQEKPAFNNVAGANIEVFDPVIVTDKTI